LIDPQPKKPSRFSFFLKQGLALFQPPPSVRSPPVPCTAFFSSGQNPPCPPYSANFTGSPSCFHRNIFPPPNFRKPPEYLVHKGWDRIGLNNKESAGPPPPRFKTTRRFFFRRPELGCFSCFLFLFFVPPRASGTTRLPPRLSPPSWAPHL